MGHIHICIIKNHLAWIQSFTIFVLTSMKKFLFMKSWLFPKFVNCNIPCIILQSWNQSIRCFALIYFQLSDFIFIFLASLVLTLISASKSGKLPVLTSLRLWKRLSWELIILSLVSAVMLLFSVASHCVKLA